MRLWTTPVVVALLLALPGPAQATSLTYDVTQSRVSGPPYPTAPVTVDVFHAPDAIHTLGVSLFDARQPPDPITPLPMTLLGSDDGDGRAPGRVGRIDAVLGVIPDDNFPARSVFDMIVAVMGVEPSPFLPVSPPRLGAVSASAFDVLFDLRDDGLVVAHRLHVAIGPGQPLTFATVQVSPPQSPSFHLTFELERTGGVPLDVPLFTAQVQGTATPVPEPDSAVLLGLGVVGLLGYGWRRYRVSA